MFRGRVPPIGDRRLRESRLSLLAETMKAALRGRSLGATKAHLYLDDGINPRQRTTSLKESFPSKPGAERGRPAPAVALSRS